MQVTKEVFQAAGGRLKVVGRAGVGVDNVDLASATDMPPPLCQPSPSTCKQRAPVCMTRHQCSGPHRLRTGMLQPVLISQQAAAV